MTQCVENLTIFANIVGVQNPEEAYTPSHTHTAQIDNGR